MDETSSLSMECLDRLFNLARTPRGWLNRDVEISVLYQLYDLVKMGPTSANCQPARFTFLSHPVSKEKLRPALTDGNIDLALSAPVIVIVAYDPIFYEKLPILYPAVELRSWYAGDMPFAEETALRNSTLQGGYMIVAARSLGLDVAPLSGFDNTMVDRLFFEEQGWHSNFLICLGYGNKENIGKRNERLAFEEACLML
ncbi:malonic semialdehyde reductase [Commensalibacter sp. M0402]|uniref:malonic semialdehyde reductase n=1 Tax=Commensalibacter TaxID=1079922 RepID=UPI0018DC8EFD|nr:MULTISPECIES: malonic semialdehyde reductase [Commensalibacter]MBI0083146.1 malonic semialdehyde reductase [Commensalibacter sp. W6292M3]MBI0088036.1 malonic semialdehyde reductase [Commensalibacter melissae]